MSTFAFRSLLAAATLALASCGGGGSSGGDTLTVAATAVPHAEILEVVEPLLAKDGPGCSPLSDWMVSSDGGMHGAAQRPPGKDC